MINTAPIQSSVPAQQGLQNDSHDSTSPAHTDTTEKTQTVAEKLQCNSASLSNSPTIVSNNITNLKEIDPAKIDKIDQILLRQSILHISNIAIKTLGVFTFVAAAFIPGLLPTVASIYLLTGIFIVGSLINYGLRESYANYAGRKDNDSNPSHITQRARLFIHSLLSALPLISLAYSLVGKPSSKDSSNENKKSFYGNADNLIKTQRQHIGDLVTNSGLDTSLKERLNFSLRADKCHDLVPQAVNLTDELALQTGNQGMIRPVQTAYTQTKAVLQDNHLPTPYKIARVLHTSSLTTRVTAGLALMSSVALNITQWVGGQLTFLDGVVSTIIDNPIATALMSKTTVAAYIALSLIPSIINHTSELAQIRSLRAQLENQKTANNKASDDHSNNDNQSTTPSNPG